MPSAENDGVHDVISSLGQNRRANKASNILGATTTALLLAVGLCALINYERPIVAEIEKGRAGVQAMIDSQFADLLNYSDRMGLQPVLIKPSPQYPSMPWHSTGLKPAFGWFGPSTYATYAQYLDLANYLTIHSITFSNSHQLSEDPNGLHLPSKYDFVIGVPGSRDNFKNSVLKINPVPDSSTIELIFKQDSVAPHAILDSLKEKIGDANFFPQEGDNDIQRDMNNYSLRLMVSLADRVKRVIKLPPNAKFLPDANLRALSVFGTNTKGQDFKIQQLLSPNHIRIEINKASPDQDSGQNPKFREVLNKLKGDVETKQTVLRDVDIHPLVAFLNE